MPTHRASRRSGRGSARRVARCGIVFLVSAGTFVGMGGAADALASIAAPGGGAMADVAHIATREPWIWPVEGSFRLDRPFVAPVHDYGPAHRGIDILPSGSSAVTAPAGGIVAFSGVVAGRGIVTIDHGDGLVTTLEPVTSGLRPGIPVARGDTVGDLSLGGHADPGRLHFGVRWNGEYVNPLLLLDGVPRAILLPCCEWH
jgi:murein DD-endopeptidase MepM/ murein hydrolase activator NlpD